MKRTLALGFVFLVLCCLLTTAVAAAYLLLPGGLSRPIVQISTPRAGEQVQVGQDVTIHSIARDDQKVKRVELWVDGQLLDAQMSNLPGGISPFPLTAPWQPRTAGAHTVIVRAFNTANNRGHASIQVNATQSADRDGDGIADDADACPDQPGASLTRGCPDRDSDGIRDSDDACPDQPGVSDARGCPAPGAGDRDGDGVADGNDACPDQPGTSSAGGCPDADGDGTPDSTDACPREPGFPERSGCPAPGDSDGDGVADASDACPREPGSAASAGCPDRDGDGVRDALDLCPDVPGTRENAGCPPSSAGDRDGDGVRDDTDLAPDEAGSADSGGAPPPGGGADRDGDGFPDDEGAPADPLGDVTGEVVPGERLSGVTFDALEFQVSEDYVARTEIYCYAGLAGRAEERIGPFDSLGRRLWDIAEYVGGAHSRFVAVPAGTPLGVRAECYASIRDHTGTDHLFELGSIAQNHPESDWDGHVVTARSSGGTGGQYFQVKYRMCRGSCSSTEFPPPILHLYSIGGRRQFVWLWEGDRTGITGFMLYAGSFRILLRPSLFSYWAPLWLRPPCGERREFQMTAYRGDRESPRSNTVYWSGERCPRTVRVSFQTLRVGDLGRDGLSRTTGPIYGHFSAAGSSAQRISFDTSDYRLRPNNDHTIQGIIDASRRAAGERMVDETNAVVVELGSSDSLTFGGRIRDRDFGRDDTLFELWRELRPSEIVPGEFTLTSGHITLIVQIQVLSSP
jgi:hypothetical protein